jgi:hypothetical protein
VQTLISDERKFREKPKIKNFKFCERKIFEKFFFKVCCDYHSVFGLGFAVLDAYIRAYVRVKAKNLFVSPDV